MEQNRRTPSSFTHRSLLPSTVGGPTHHRNQPSSMRHSHKLEKKQNRRRRRRGATSEEGRGSCSPPHGASYPFRRKLDGSLISHSQKFGRCNGTEKFQFHPSLKPRWDTRGRSPLTTKKSSQVIPTPRVTFSRDSANLFRNQY